MHTLINLFNPKGIHFGHA